MTSILVLLGLVLVVIAFLGVIAWLLPDPPRWTWPLLFLIALFFVFTDPEGSGEVAGGFGDFLVELAGAIDDFASGLADRIAPPDDIDPPDPGPEPVPVSVIEDPPPVPDGVPIWSIDATDNGDVDILVAFPDPEGPPIVQRLPQSSGPSVWSRLLTALAGAGGVVAIGVAVYRALEAGGFLHGTRFRRTEAAREAAERRKDRGR